MVNQLDAVHGRLRHAAGFAPALGAGAAEGFAARAGALEATRVARVLYMCRMRGVNWWVTGITHYESWVWS